MNQFVPVSKLAFLPTHLINILKLLIFMMK